MDLLRRETGSAFDARVVDALARVIEGETRERPALAPAFAAAMG
jgi:hypothetical protein